MIHIKYVIYKENRGVNLKPFGITVILANERKSPMLSNLIFALKVVVAEYKLPSGNHIFPLASLNVPAIFTLLQPPYPYKGICQFKL